MKLIIDLGEVRSLKDITDALREKAKLLSESVQYSSSSLKMPLQKRTFEQIQLASKILGCSLVELSEEINNIPQPTKESNNKKVKPSEKLKI